MKIVKLENGNVQLLSDSGELIKSLSPSATLQIAQEGEAVRVNYGKNNIHDIYPSEVNSLQVLPSLAVPFSGTLQELFTELSENFFFDEVGADGTIPETAIIQSALDIPPVLAANTVYIIVGEVSIASPIIASNVNSSIIGLDPEKDALIYTGTGTFITITEQSFKFENVRLEAAATGAQVLSATNYTLGAAPAYGRTKRLTFTNVIIRNVYNVMSVIGFDIVDFLNTIVTNVTGAEGVSLRDVSKLQVTSCEFIRWYDSATGTIFSTASMLELRSNGPDNVGFGAIDITGSIFHPQQTQIGIEANALSTTGFGTIVGNTFVSAGLTTGALTSIDVNATAGRTFVIKENQGLLNEIGLVEMRLAGNTLTTALTTVNIPVQVNGGTAFTFPVTNRVITTNTGTIEGNLLRPTYFYVNVNITAEMQSGGVNQIINFYFAVNGTVIPFAKGTGEFDQNIPQSLGFSVTGLAQSGDVFSIFVENATNSGTNIIISDLSLSGFGL